MVYVYIPVTITNSESTATSTDFQQLVTVDLSYYSAFLNQDLSNTFFSSDTAGSIIVTSWLESGNTYPFSSVNFWIYLTGSIPANSSITIYLQVDLTGTSHFNTTTTGVAPQLSSTYAEYDDGANVFTEYWNFAGTTLPSAFTNLTTGGTFSYTVDNGLTLTGYSSASDTNYALHIYTTAQYAPSIIEADIYSASLQTAASWELAYTTTAPNTSVTNDTGFVNDYRLDWFNSDFRLIKDVSGLDVVLRFKYTGSTNTGIMSLAFPATGTEIVYLNYADMESATDTSITYADANLDVALVSSSTSSSTFSIYWLRTRSYPPNGVMPFVTAGTPSNFPYYNTTTYEDLL